MESIADGLPRLETPRTLPLKVPRNCYPGSCGPPESFSEIQGRCAIPPMLVDPRLWARPERAAACGAPCTGLARKPGEHCAPTERGTTLAPGSVQKPPTKGEEFMMHLFTTALVAAAFACVLPLAGAAQERYPTLKPDQLS